MVMFLKKKKNNIIKTLRKSEVLTVFLRLHKNSFMANSTVSHCKLTMTRKEILFTRSAIQREVSSSGIWNDQNIIAKN